MLFYITISIFTRQQDLFNCLRTLLYNLLILFYRLSFFVLISARKKLSILVYVERVSLLPLRPGGLFVLPLIDIQRGNLG